MNRLLEIANQISHAFEDKTNISISLNHQRRDLEARRLFLAPEGGWEGKNAELRELAEKRAYAKDPTCQDIQNQIASLEHVLSLAEIALETAVNERRAEEWQIRAHLVDALTGRVFTTQNGQHVEETAFDDVSDEISDRQVTGIAEEEDIPF